MNTLVRCPYIESWRLGTKCPIITKSFRKWHDENKRDDHYYSLQISLNCWQFHMRSLTSTQTRAQNHSYSAREYSRRLCALFCWRCVVSHQPPSQLSKRVLSFRLVFDIFICVTELH